MKIAKLVRVLDCRSEDIRNDPEGNWDLSTGYPIEEFPNLETLNVTNTCLWDRLWVEERHTIAGRSLTVRAKVPQPEPIIWGEPLIKVRGSTSADLISLHVDNRFQSGDARQPGARNDSFLDSLLLEAKKMLQRRHAVSPFKALKSFEYNQFDDDFSLEEMVSFLGSCPSLRRLKIPIREEPDAELTEDSEQWMNALCNNLQHVEFVRGGRLSWLYHFRRCTTLNLHTVVGLEDYWIRAKTLEISRQTQSDIVSRLDSFTMMIVGELTPITHMVVPKYIRALTRPTTAVSVSHKIILGRQKIASPARKIWKDIFDFLEEEDQTIKREKGFWRVSEEKQDGASQEKENE